MKKQYDELAKIIPVLRAQEITSFGEVKRRLKLDDDEEAIDVLASLINSGKIKGLIDRDRRQFVLADTSAQE